MIRELLIDDAPGYLRAAVVEDGRLCEIHGEKSGSAGETESVFYGRVQAIKPSLKAAFVDIGTPLNAFLPITDGDTLRCGDWVIVQGQAKQATETKGLRVTAKINLAGKWLVLVPGQSGVRVSKKVKDPALREALMDIAQGVCPPDCGLIVRTASEGVTQQLLEEEARALYAVWQEILKKTSGMTRPGLLHGRLPLHMRLIRDMRELSRIVISSQAGYEALLATQQAQQIDAQTRIELYREDKQLLFDAFGIEPQIDKALRRRVWLPCGGYLVLDFCEAMTVIDVNSGKMILGRDPEETALRVNLEAAEEIARQLRLRDVGGIVMVDFIDMRLEEHRQTLLTHMKEALSGDRSPTTVEGITRLGLMEITRKRTHTQLHKALCVSCSYCSGTGEVLSGEEVARRALRQVRRMLLSGQRGPFVIRCAPSAAQALEALPAEHAQVYALPVSGRHAEKFDIEQIGEGIPVPREARPLGMRND